MPATRKVTMKAKPRYNPFHRYKWFSYVEDEAADACYDRSTRGNARRTGIRCTRKPVCTGPERWRAVRRWRSMVSSQERGSRM
jgi:hypothetical protein